MKKLLNLLAIGVLVTTNTSIVISCKDNNKPIEEKEKKVQRQGNLMKVDSDFYTGYKNQKERALQSASGQPFKSHFITKGDQYNHTYNKELGFDQNLLSWNAGFDRDAKFNVATQSISKREVDRHPSNPVTQEVEGNIKHHSMGQTDKHFDAMPSQEFQGQVWGQSFQNWQYVDSWVSWAGGMIGAPSAPLINSAHKNGTKILGLVYFAYFTEPTWEDTAEWFAQGIEGNFLSADKLIDIALEYGFDGWMLNQEGGLKIDNSLMYKWMDYYNKKVAKINNTLGKKLLLYSYINGAAIYLDVRGQEMFYNSDVYFNDFGGNVSMSNQWIKQNTPGREADAPTLHNVEGASGGGSGLNVSNNDWIKMANVAKENEGKKLESSISMFGGSDTGMKFNIDDAEDFSKANSDFEINKFLNTLQLMHEYDNRLYAGTVEDIQFTGDKFKWYESNPQHNRGKSISSVIAERTTAINNSFKTNFSTGNGIGIYKQGKNLRPELEWNNRGVTDTTPTYKWIVNNNGGNNAQMNFDYSDAWEKSNSIALTGDWDFKKTKFNGANLKTNGSTEVELYASNIDEKGQDIELIFKAGELDGDLNVKNDIVNNLDIQLKLGYEVNGTKIAENSLYPEMKVSKSNLKAEKINDSNWYKIKAPLKDIIGKNNKLVKIGVVIKTNNQEQNNIKINFGQLLVDNKDQIDKINPVQNVEVEYAIKDKKNNIKKEDNNYNLRIYWQREKDNLQPNQEQNFDYNEIYQIDKDGNYIFLGATRDNAFFLENVSANLNRIKLSIKSIHLFDDQKTNEVIQSFKLD